MSCEFFKRYPDVTVNASSLAIEWYGEWYGECLWSSSKIHHEVEKQTCCRSISMIEYFTGFHSGYRIDHKVTGWLHSSTRLLNSSNRRTRLCTYYATFSASTPTYINIVMYTCTDSFACTRSVTHTHTHTYTYTYTQMHIYIYTQAGRRSSAHARMLAGTSKVLVVVNRTPSCQPDTRTRLADAGNEQDTIRLADAGNEQDTEQWSSPKSKPVSRSGSFLLVKDNKSFPSAMPFKVSSVDCRSALGVWELASRNFASSLLFYYMSLSLLKCWYW